MEGTGYQVIDLGIDVPPDKFNQAAKAAVQLIGMSAMLTTTMPNMKVTIDALVAAGVRDNVKIILGGAPLTQASAEQIGTDGYAADASAAVRKAKELLAAKLPIVAARCSSYTICMPASSPGLPRSVSDSHVGSERFGACPGCCAARILETTFRSLARNSTTWTRSSPVIRTTTPDH